MQGNAGTDKYGRIFAQSSNAGRSDRMPLMEGDADMVFGDDMCSKRHVQQFLPVDFYIDFHFQIQKIIYMLQAKSYFRQSILSLRQSILCPGKVYFAQAKYTLPRQGILCPGKVYFAQAGYTLPRQSILCLGKFLTHALLGL